MSTPAYHLNGDEPALAGKICTAFILQHFLEGTRITDQVNVAHLRFDQQWYRLYFECQTIFWRTSSAPETPQNSNLSFGLLLNDLSGMDSVVGQVVESVAYDTTESGDVSVEILFLSGSHLRFAYSSELDSTTIDA